MQLNFLLEVSIVTSYRISTTARISSLFTWYLLISIFFHEA